MSHYFVYHLTEETLPHYSKKFSNMIWSRFNPCFPCYGTLCFSDKDFFQMQYVNIIKALESSISISFSPPPKSNPSPCPILTFSHQSYRLQSSNETLPSPTSLAKPEVLPVLGDVKHYYLTEELEHIWTSLFLLPTNKSQNHGEGREDRDGLHSAGPFFWSNSQ